MNLFDSLGLYNTYMVHVDTFPLGLYLKFCYVTNDMIMYQGLGIILGGAIANPGGASAPLRPPLD